MSARRQRPPWYNCSNWGCVSFEARRQRESCRRKTADSLEPPRYRCKGNVLLMTWPSYCFQEKLIIAPQVGEFLPPLNAGTCIRPAGYPRERGGVLDGAGSSRLEFEAPRPRRSPGLFWHEMGCHCE